MSPYLGKALEITGGFEGRGFDQVTGDFDGQGISAGILQWCYGQDSLQMKILLPYLKRHGSIDEKFGFPWPGIDSTATMQGERAVSYARAHMLVGAKVKMEWEACWRRFLNDHDTNQIQTEAAADVGSKAEHIARDWGLDSLRSFCFFFDIVTQNGSMKEVKREPPNLMKCLAVCDGPHRPANRTIWRELLLNASNEQLILFDAAYERALISRPTFFQDVLARKGTIALGRGVVHGKSWDLFPPA